MRVPLVGAFVACLAAASTRSAAVDIGSLGDEAVTLDVTEASSLSYNADNRNTRPADVAAQADDEWGLWYNRLNLQANRGQWQLGLRVDSAWFYTSRLPADIALELLEIEQGGELGDTFTPEDVEFFLSKFNEAGQELSTRFSNWIYPAKYKLRYASSTIEATLGDEYAQLGRGLVLSVRKFDELSADTTVRGARVTTRHRIGNLRLKLTALGGYMNPLRIDEASGRYLGVDDNLSPWLVQVVEAGMPRIQATDFAPNPEPTYSPDRLVAAGVQFGDSFLQLGFQGSFLERDQVLSLDVVRSADDIKTGSVSLEAPNLAEHGAAYAEFAVQSLSHQADPAQDLDGYALYTSVSASAAPVTLTFEGKHYRRFFPLRGNIDIGRAREFAPVQYSAPPTTEPVYNDTEFEGFNTCVTGGRLEGDVAVGPHQSVFASGAHYSTWAETSTNEHCNTSRNNLNRVWDWGVGFELSGARGKSNAMLLIGTRFDHAAEPFVDRNGDLRTLFYREGYTRYDITTPLGPGYALQFTGWHRRRHQTVGGPEGPYYQGQALQAFHWGSAITIGAGFEYTTNPAFPLTYLNGQVTYNIDSASNLSLFVGQRQGGLRCTAGVCRIFPPFEGSRLDATFRF